MHRECNCCLSKKISRIVLDIDGYFFCRKCGLVFRDSSLRENIREKIVKHYSIIDPHKDVANAKNKIFEHALNFLDTKKMSCKKLMLDIGCGFGYFIEMANREGWNTFGLDIAEKAVQSAKKKVGHSQIFHGTLKEANYDDSFFDVITLWDVLSEMEDPFTNIKECHRVLSTNGKIGIRVRNLFFQKFAYRFYSISEKFKLDSKFKKPYVFNKFCFNRKSIYLILSRAGFQNIRITNSPLTDGDPYQHIKNHTIIKIAKTLCKIASDMIYWSSFRKLIIGPSLLIWAEKTSK
jgi:2-polyprenyl-3-methyl-5-hydroxy-6-metoxy-1,4-benzoquinol methylase